MKLNGLHILAIAVLATTMVGCNKSKDGFATVNGVPITNSELIEYLETKQTVRANVNNQIVNVSVADTLAFQALQDIIVRKLVMQMAKDEGVLPTDDEVKAHITLLGEVNPAFVQNMQSRGIAMKGIREQVKVDLAQQNILAKGINVSDQEVEDYIKNNKAEFQDPAKAEMYWIVANAQSKNTAESDLLKGTKFEDVAVKYSMDPEAKQTGGKFGSRQFVGGAPLSALAPDFRTAVEATAAGKTTEWIPIPNQAGLFAKFYVVRKTEARDQEMTPARKELVKRGLEVNRGSQTKDLKDKLANMLREAKIEVTDDALKDLWQKFDENLKKQAGETALPGQTEADQPAQ